MFDLNVVNAFSTGTVSILKDYCQASVERTKEIEIHHKVPPINGIGIFVGIFGDLDGRILVTMSNDTGYKLASVLNGEIIEKVDDIFIATLKEFTNMLCGMAINQLSTQDVDLDMTTPTIMMGEHISLMEQTREKILIIDYDTNLGKMSLNIIISEDKD